MVAGRSKQISRAIPTTICAFAPWLAGQALPSIPRDRLPRGRGRAMTAARLRYLLLVGAPIAFGVWSLCLGQDAGWDLRNYHWYNPYALLTGRAALDGAPAGLQTWFAPYIDLVWVGLAQALPAPVVGFIIGAGQSASFLLLLLLGDPLLPIERAFERRPVALLAAGA